MNSKKFLLISHIIPPSPSGQAVVLYHLLKDTKSDLYDIVTDEPYYNCEATHKLEANTFNFQFDKIAFKGYFSRKLGIILNKVIEPLKKYRYLKSIIKQNNYGFIIACTGNFYDLPIAYHVSKRFGIPFVIYMFDDYVYQWTGVRRKIASLLAPKIVKKAKNIIFPNEFIEQDYKLRYDVTGSIIRNICTISESGILNDSFKSGDEYNIVYAGSIYHAHFDAFNNMIKAIDSIKTMKIKLHVFTSQTSTELSDLDINRQSVILHSHVPQTSLHEIMRSADALFLPLAFKTKIPEVIRTSAPGKMAEYLSMGKPVIVHAPEDSFISYYFKKNECGLVVTENDSDRLKEELGALISDTALQTKYGQNAKKQYDKDYNNEKQRSIFNGLIDSI